MKNDYIRAEYNNARAFFNVRDGVLIEGFLSAIISTDSCRQID